MKALHRAGPLDVCRLLFVGAVWGASFIFIALALRSYGPMSVAAGRISLAAVVLIGVCLVAGNRIPRSAADWRMMTGIGLLNSALPFFLVSWGMQYISSAEAALLMATATFFALLISHFTSSDERINRYRVIGVGVGFCGVLVLVIFELFETGFGAVMGELAVIAAGLSYAISSVMSRRIGHIPPMTAAGCIVASASVYMVPLALFLERPFATSPSVWSVIGIVFLGVVATALAYVIRLQIITRNGAVFMSQVGYLVPIFGVFWSWLFLAEIIPLKTFAALTMILIGIAITRRGT